MIEILAHPFMQRALAGGTIIALLSGLIGILVVLRRSSFYGDAIAHVSLAGVALGLLLHSSPTLWAIIFAAIISLVIPMLEKNSRLPVDNLLGFILPFAMGISIILLSIIPGYQPELMSFLFGSILSINLNDLLTIGVFAFVTLSLFVVFKNQLMLLSFDPVQAKLAGIKVSYFEIMYNIIVAVVIVLGAKLVGVVLVNALLVIPASIVRIHAKSLKHLYLMTPIISLVIVVTGLVGSILLDLPSGPTIAVFAGILLLLSTAIKNLKN